MGFAFVGLWWDEEYSSLGMFSNFGLKQVATWLVGFAAVVISWFVRLAAVVLSWLVIFAAVVIS